MDYYYNDYELIYLIKEDNEEALNILIRKYEPLINNLANHYLLVFNDLKIEYDDLIQEGRMGLIKAIKGFKVEKEILFYTFALLCAKRQMLTYIDKISAKKNKNLIKAVYIEENPILESITDYKHPQLNIEDDEFIKEIINFKNSLENKDSMIFELRFSGFSYLEISNLLDIEEKDVDNSLLKIRKKLKKYLYDYNKCVL